MIVIALHRKQQSEFTRYQPRAFKEAHPAQIMWVRNDSDASGSNKKGRLESSLFVGQIVTPGPLSSGIIFWRRSFSSVRAFAVSFSAWCAFTRCSTRRAATLRLFTFNTLTTSNRSCDRTVKVKLGMNFGGLFCFRRIHRMVSVATRATTAATACGPFVSGLTFTVLPTVRALSLSLIAITTVLATIPVATTTTVAATTITTFTAIVIPALVPAFAAALAAAFLVAFAVAINLEIVVIGGFRIGVRATQLVEHALVMICKLIIIFSHDAITGLFGLARLGFVFF